MNSERKYWVAFNLVKGIGAVRFRALLKYFGDAKSAWEGNRSELRAAGLSPKLVEAVHQVRSSNLLEAAWEQIESQEICLVTWEDQAYPRHLKEIDQPPPVLFVKGELQTEDEWAVAIVGTRRVTGYGRQVAEEIARVLAQNQVTIVSGLARGVDAIAHQAALQAGGRSIAVLGSGVDVIYPSEHRRLAHRLVETGALISDYPPGTPPEAGNFPPRNRIISGLSLAVIVIEAGERSGALITARFAADQGRDVFAVPGNIYAAQSKGTNRLIQQGAQPLLTPEDVLAALDLTFISEQRAARSFLPVDPVEEVLLNQLTQEPCHIDELSRAVKIPVAEISASLTLMELKGMVRQVGGMHYVAVGEAQRQYFASIKNNTGDSKGS